MPGSALPFCIGSDTWPGLAKLAEESGELTQVLCKVMAFPDEVHPDGKGDLRERLIEETGDVAAALEFFIEANGLDLEALSERRNKKLKRFRKWDREERERRA